MKTTYRMMDPVSLCVRDYRRAPAMLGISRAVAGLLCLNPAHASPRQDRRIDFQ